MIAVEKYIIQKDGIEHIARTVEKDFTKMKDIGFVPEVCECCKQTKTYIYGLDRGTAQILMAIARHIQSKGINYVHPRKENVLTAVQWSNLSRLKRHGLVVGVKGEIGNILLTKKGASFLRGASVPRFAIISKVTGHQIGYYEPEKYMVTIDEVLNGEQWEGINYTIEEGRVILDIPIKIKDESTNAATLF